MKIHTQITDYQTTKMIDMLPGAQQLGCATNFTSLNAITNRHTDYVLYMVYIWHPNRANVPVGEHQSAYAYNVSCFWFLLTLFMTSVNTIIVLII